MSKFEVHDEPQKKFCLKSAMLRRLDEKTPEMFERLPAQKLKVAWRLDGAPK